MVERKESPQGNALAAIESAWNLTDSERQEFDKEIIKLAHTYRYALIEALLVSGDGISAEVAGEINVLVEEMGEAA